VPPDGLRVTPAKSLDEVQTRSPCEPDASATVAEHMKLPLLSGEQAPPPVAVSVGGVQLHDTGRDCGWAAPEAVKVKVPLLQAMPEMDTDCGTPGERVPLDGLKVALTSLLAVQVILPVELELSVRVTVQDPVPPQVLESKLVGLTDHAGTAGEGDGDGEGDGEGDGDGDGEGEGDGDGEGEGGGVVPGGLVGEGIGLGDGVGVTPVTTSVTATVVFPAFEVILTVPE
jgi:hypothetical protein